MNRLPFLLVLFVLVAFVAWGSWNLLLPAAPLPAEPEPVAWRAEPAPAAELGRRLPAWAELLEESGLDRRSGLPTPIRDTRTGIVYALVPAGRMVLGNVRHAGYINEREPFRPYDPEELATEEIELGPFYLSREEVTWGVFRRFLTERGTEDGVDAGAFASLREYPDDRPAIYATQPEAVAFARWAGGRLPGEAEWEYAAKGPVAALLFPWGPIRDLGDARLAADLEEILGPEGVFAPERALAPCGSSERDRSWCGVRDLAGNVAEWTADAWSQFPRRKGATDLDSLFDAGSETRLPRSVVVRGGSWASSLYSGRCTQRSAAGPLDRRDFLGFRVLRSLD